MTEIFKAHVPTEIRGKTANFLALDEAADFPVTPVAPEPRAWTADEIRDMLIEKFRSIADYWATTDLKRPEFGIKTLEEDIAYRCHGVAFTMLSTLDGCSMDLPGFDLIPTPDPSDKAFHIEEGSNWFDRKTRISTTLHEYYHRKEREDARA